MKKSIIVVLISLLINVSCQTTRNIETISNKDKNYYYSDVWEYAIKFPNDWNRYEENNNYFAVPNMDVYCKENDDVETEIYLYSYHPSRDINNFINRIRKNNYERIEIETDNWYKNENEYYKIVFKDEENIIYYTVIFNNKIQLMMRAKSSIEDYNIHENIFASIIKTIKFNQKDDIEYPIEKDNRWKSYRWKYSINFPNTWNNYDRLEFETDVRCLSWWDAITIVAAYEIDDNVGFEELNFNILTKMAEQVYDFQLLNQEREYKKMFCMIKNKYKMKSNENSEHRIGELIVIKKEKTIYVLDQATFESNYQYDKYDFEEIQDSFLSSVRN